MSLKILAVGKKHESWVLEGIERFSKRLQAPMNAEWIFLAHSALTGLSARQDESERLLSRLNANDYVILLDERGRELDSPGLAALIERQLAISRKIIFIIGGAYGVDDRIRQRADTIWSLSPLVFPHQLVRLILIEQLYRAQEINSGGPYHHE
jgi:23S rRNA (pseudouridine1915-N3)-methyltransferase